MNLQICKKSRFFPSYSDSDQDGLSQLRAGIGSLSHLYGYYSVECIASLYYQNNSCKL